jgi:hypothetical protein
MPGKKRLPRCMATTMRGEQCKARAVKDGLCPAHHPHLASEWKERNRVALLAYWAGRRIAEQFVAASGAALD